MQVEKEVVELAPNKSVIGRTFKGDSAAILAALDKHQPEELTAVKQALDTEGYVGFSLSVAC